MASVSSQRSTNGVGSQGADRKTSLSSFPPSRSASALSIRGIRSTRSPQPPISREPDSTRSSSRPSLRSSMSISGPQFNAAPRRRKMRSQYPANSSENHVEYILVASFDIDRGSVMEHQYPGPISGDEHMLAELMLPDQAHVRSQDWTIFFLHKDTGEEEGTDERKERRRRRRKKAARGRSLSAAGSAGRVDGLGTDEADSATDDGQDEEFEDDEDDDEVEGPPLIYVLNLVNTKRDSSVSRGALVKAMAVCTRHSFLHIYKPLLLLALEEYFRAPTPETLASLYDSVNSMDLSLMPRLSSLEKHILQASEAKDMFIEKFEQMIRQRMAEDAEQNGNSSPSRAAKTRYTAPRDTHEFESRVLYNSIPVPIKVPTAIWPEMVGDFSLIKLIQKFSGPHGSSPQPFTPHSHLTTSGPYTHPIIVLVNALLTQKRIIFLGHNKPSGDVAEAVLAACALASGGLLRGFTRHAFPYTDLTKIDDLLKVPGFIAGVTNPAFAHKPEWWDLLCDLTEGRMKISPRLEAASPTEGLLYFQQLQQQLPPSSAIIVSQTLAISGTANPGSASSVDHTGDNAFMESLNLSIANRHGERAIRAAWRGWVLKFTRIAAAFEEAVFGASALFIGAHETEVDAQPFGVSGHGYVWSDEMSRLRELAANVHRVEGWRTTRSYYSFVQDLGTGWTKMPIRGLDFLHQADRLRSLKLGHDGCAAIYLAFSKAVEDAGAGLVAARESSNPANVGAGAGSTSASPPDAQNGTAAGTSGGGAAPPPPPAGGGGPGTSPPPQQRQPQADSRRQYNTILQLLSVVPESQNGLFYISLGLFHPRQDVRVAVVRLLERVRTNEAGRHFWASLGRFPKLAFFRVKREEEGAGGGVVVGRS